MKNATKDSPFTPGAGRTPPLLAGREEATGRLRLVLHRLTIARVKSGKLKLPPYSPVRIVAPPGGGRRTLLAWIEREARQRGIRVARCSCPDPKDAGGDLYEPVLAAMVDEDGWGAPARRLLEERMGTADVEHLRENARSAVSLLLARLPDDERLALVMDDLQHYSQGSIDWLLFTTQHPISRGFPFSLILAGTPMMDVCLFRTKARFIARAEHIYIGALSDEATRDALRTPFEQAGVAVTPDALEALAAQTDNYPYFIQLAGAAAWEAMAAAGRNEIDAELVRQSEAKAREGRASLYAPCYELLQENELLRYAVQTMELLDGHGGKVPEDDVIDALVEDNPDVDGKKAEEIYESLCESSFIWTVDNDTVTGMPSFFGYLTARQKKKIRKF
ncbi:MAG: ATP-binding protein [Ectothiorhodospiraceae bacterium AqS1]|nr:ATP-binding protein [Ectothiorhodospiraceae bacterium AqS1]